MSSLSNKEYDVTILTNDVGIKRVDHKKIKIVRIKNSHWFKIAYLYRFGKQKRLIDKIASKGLRLIFDKFIKLDFWEFKNQVVLDKLVEYSKSVDHIIFSALPYSSYNLIIDLKPKLIYKGCKLWLDVGDPLSFNSVNHKYKNGSKEELEKSVISTADGVIITNQKTKSVYQENLIDDNHYWVIPQGFDDQIFQDKNSEEKSNNENQLVYAGAIYPKLRPIEPLIQFISEQKIYTLNIIGAKYPRSTQVRILPRLNQEEIVQEYRNASWLVFIDNHYGIQTPGKIYELLAMKKPILFLFKEKTETYEICRDFPQVSFVKNDYTSIKKYFNKHQIPEKAHYPKAHTWDQRAELLIEALSENLKYDAT